MCTKNNPSLNIAALGRPFQLGMLYDYRSDKLIPDISVWESDPSSQHISWQPLSWKKCELYMTDTFTEKADLLNIDNNLKLSVLANLVKLSRSEKLIDDRNQTNHVLRFILKYSVTKNLHALTMTNMKIRDSKYREVLDQKIATHIVTDIVYGGDIFFVLDRTLSNDEDRTDIENRIKQFLIKFETFQVLDNGTLNWNYHEKELAQTLRCQYYGDFPTDSNPRTFEEIDFMNDLRKQDNIRQLARPFAEVQKNYASQSILRLIIHVTAKNDLFLKEILQCLDGNIKELTHQYTTQDFWFNDDNLSLIMNRIRLFIKFAELNNSQPNFEFIVNEEYADEFQMNKGVTCLLYENSVATNFEIPSKPGRPIATKVSDCNVTLHWAKPIYGSQHIQHYKIYSKCIMPNSKWKLLLSTTDAKTSVNIPHLRKRKYQFKIQGTTLVGDTIESDASDIIG
ncbi:unnamed protein product [Rotaria sp. Silwood1]|nr:unnamed protein product [Rotaria sp. Silwood1]CAF4944701.1 unnamed protein product [Rotaria sp. Silwood1]